MVPVERLIDELPDDVVQSRRTSLGEAQRGASGWGYAHIEVTPTGGDFVEQEKRRHELAEQLKPKLEQIKQAHPEFDRLSVKYSKKGEERDVVEVYVSGGDRIPFETIQNEIRGAVQDIETVKRVEMDPARFQTAWTFDVDEKTALAYDSDETTGEEVESIIEEELEPVRQKYPGYRVSVEASQQTSEMKQWLLRVGAMCLLSVFVVLALALNSLIQPVLILFALVFGFVGAILALFLQGMIITLGWGLLSATLLTLILLPCIVAILQDVRRLPAWVAKGG